MDIKKPVSNPIPNPIPSPDKIEGYDFKVMVKIADYAKDHEPLNGYFDPNRTVGISEKELEDKIQRQKEAYSYTFTIIEEMLSKSPNLDTKVIDQIFREMGNLYGFNYDQNRAYVEFRNYYIQSRDYMRTLRSQHPDNKDLYRVLTNKEVMDKNNLRIKQGPFAFEIYTSQQDLNKLLPANSESGFFGKLKERVLPSRNIGGMAGFIANPNNEIVVANYIALSYDDPGKDMFNRFNKFVNDYMKGIAHQERNLPFTPSDPSNSRFIKHETQHALYNLILRSNRQLSAKDVKKELDSIINTNSNNAIKMEEFILLCNYVNKNSFYENAAHEILARIKDGNFNSGILTILDREFYNYFQFNTPSNLTNENKEIDRIFQSIDKSVTGPMGEKLKEIYHGFAEQTKEDIEKTVYDVARFIDKYPNYHQQLTNILMFERFEFWRDAIKKYEEYLLNRSK
jgi:hypothetical protein